MFVGAAALLADRFLGAGPESWGGNERRSSVLCYAWSKVIGLLSNAESRPPSSRHTQSVIDQGDYSQGDRTEPL